MTAPVTPEHFGCILLLAEELSRYSMMIVAVVVSKDTYSKVIEPLLCERPRIMALPCTYMYLLCARELVCYYVRMVPFLQGEASLSLTMAKEVG